jgi:hypothetical protein
MQTKRLQLPSTGEQLWFLSLLFSVVVSKLADEKMSLTTTEPITAATRKPIIEGDEFLLLQEERFLKSSSNIEIVARRARQ